MTAAMNCRGRCQEDLSQNKIMMSGRTEEPRRDYYHDLDDDDDGDNLYHRPNIHGRPCLSPRHHWAGFCNPWTQSNNKSNRDPLLVIVDGKEEADAALLAMMESSVATTTISSNSSSSSSSSSSSRSSLEDDDASDDDVSFYTARGSVATHEDGHGSEEHENCMQEVSTFLQGTACRCVSLLSSSSDQMCEQLLHLENVPINHTPSTTNYAKAFCSYEQRWSPENIESVATSWNLTEYQRQFLLDMQQCIQTNNGCDSYWMNDPNQCVYYLEYTEWKSVEHAVDMWKKVAHWRNQQTGDNPHSFLYAVDAEIIMTVDNILDTYSPPPDFDFFPHFVPLQGVDRDGDPIVCTRMGVTDCYGLYGRHGRDELLRYALYCQENMVRGAWLEDYERQQQRKVTRLTAIFDLEGLSASHARGGLLPLLGTIARFSQDNYLEIVKLVVIVNAPPIFHWIWNVVKHFVDAELRETMMFASSADYSCQLLEHYMDPNVLPCCFHPDGEDGRVARGFEHIQWQGGKLPPRGEHHRSGRTTSPNPHSSPPLDEAATERTNQQPQPRKCVSFITGQSIASGFLEHGIGPMLDAAINGNPQ